MLKRQALWVRIALAFFISQYVSGSFALADQGANNIYGKIAELYMKLATANQTGLVFKFAPKEIYKIALYCEPSVCRSNRLKELFGLLDFAKFDYTILENENNTDIRNFDFVIEFIRAPEVERNLVELELRTSHVSNGTFFFRSEGEQKCRSLSALIPQRNLVVQVAIWLNQDMPQNQLNTCLLMQLARGTGLNTKLTFSDGWKTDGELSRFNPEQLSQFSTGLRNLLSIHFRNDVIPGMTLDELKKIMN